jgi:pyruvate formate lyase activating enzyme
VRHEGLGPDRCLRRRALLASLARAGLAAAVAAPAVRALLEFEDACADSEAGDGGVEVSHWEQLTDKRVQCHVCPFDCVLDDGETCRCRTRQNRGGRLYNNAYANPCIVRTDPIEKTPLNHVLAGEKVLSVATGGCILRCLYCQNWQESQSRPRDLRTVELSPRDAVRGVVEANLRTICFTYTDPVAFSEYARDVSRHAKERGVRTVMATSAFMNPEPFKDLLKSVSAVAVGLKGFDDAYYTKVCGVPLEPVLDALLAAKSAGVWIEITSLVVPSLNDDRKAITAMCRWIRKNMGADVPLHFARFVPEHKLKDLPRTPIPTLEEARDVALAEGLRFVYLSNVAPHEGNRTCCPSCKKVLIDRVGFKVLTNDMKGGACGFCRAKIPGLWA